MPAIVGQYNQSKFKSIKFRWEADSEIFVEDIKPPWVTSGTCQGFFLFTFDLDLI